MVDPRSQTKNSFSDFLYIYQDGGFWSCCGYDGLSLVFDLPLDALHSLPEDQKRALMHVLSHLAKTGDESLQDQIRALEGRTLKERLTGLVHLSAQYAA